MRVTIREAELRDAGGIARVQVESWHTTFEGVLPADYLAQITYEVRLPRWVEVLEAPEEHHFVYVAETDAGEVVGFASGGREREGDPDYDGELYAIYILDAFHRQGVGRTLTLAVVDRLVAAGFGSMLVWALEVNDARGFYERLGGRLVRRGHVGRAPHIFDTVAYGWTDAPALAARLRAVTE